MKANKDFEYVIRVLNSSVTWNKLKLLKTCLKILKISGRKI